MNSGLDERKKENFKRDTDLKRLICIWPYEKLCEQIEVIYMQLGVGEQEQYRTVYRTVGSQKAFGGYGD